MKFLIVTGLSGSGKSGAVNVLEDMGYYCIDNIPPQLIPKFAEVCFQSKMEKVAIVTDIRGIAAESGRSDISGELVSGFDYLRRSVSEGEVGVLFLDASDETLIKRYKETRRRHPLFERTNGSISEAVAMERSLMSPVRETADYYIDTSDMAIAQLKEKMVDLFMDNPDDRMSVQVMSFGFKYGVPGEADLVFDVRCLPNPFYLPELKHKTGRDAEVRDYVMSFEQSRVLRDKLFDMIEFLLPHYVAEGKSRLVIAFGCTGGKHRSVTFAELTAAFLKEKECKVKILHRDIEK